MLEVVNLTKKYGKTLAADGIGFTVPDGKIGILLGPNGAGKSTVIKSIAGLLRYQGSIRIQGLDAGTVEAKKCFAYVPELPYMYEALTVREHIEFIVRAYGREGWEEEARALFDRFELTDKQYKLGNELSKGMMQKVSICCALIIRPKVILLDEPMVGAEDHAPGAEGRGLYRADQHPYAGNGEGTVGRDLRDEQRAYPGNLCQGGAGR